MKIEVAKPDLEAALHVVSIGASSTGSDLTTHFVFRHKEEDNTVEVLSNNNRIGCSMPLQGVNVSRSDDNDSFTVESWRLNKWISAVEDAVLTLELKDGLVKATSPKGSVKFQSLDPKKFAYWDKTLSEVKASKTVRAKRFQAALSHVKLFISDKDTTMPKLAVTELKGDALQATDRDALAVAVLKDLEGIPLRIHGKDLGQVLSFLNQSGDEEVELKEHDQCTFVVRHDGGVLAIGRPPHAFPEINIDRADGDPIYWDLRKDEIVSAINTLAASASREDVRLTFNLAKEGVVSLSMMSASGERVVLNLETQDMGSDEGAPPFPENGFDISYPYLLKLLGQWKSEVVRFGIYQRIDEESGKATGGWIRFREDRDGDEFLTLLVWLV